MPLDENGFLGKDALALAARIRERKKSLFEFCFEINRFAQKLKNELVVNESDQQKLLAAVFFIRVLEGAQAAIVLVERGFELEASTILRSAFESLMYLKCTFEEQFACDYMLYAEINRCDDLKKILEFKIFEVDKRFGNEADVKKMIFDIEEVFKKKGLKIGEFKKRFQKRELARKAGMLRFYASFYSVTSDDAHTGMGALQKHLKLDKHEINHGPSDEDAKEHLTFCAEFILRASACVCELFKIEKNAEIEGFSKRMKEL